MWDFKRSAGGSIYILKDQKENIFLISYFQYFPVNFLNI